MPIHRESEVNSFLGGLPLVVSKANKEVPVPCSSSTISQQWYVTMGKEVRLKVQLVLAVLSFIGKPTDTDEALVLKFEKRAVGLRGF